MGSDRVRYPRELAAELLPLMSNRGAASSARTTEAPLAEAFDGSCLARAGAPLPSQSALEQIFDYTYVTSLANEEGRACLATVAYVSPASAIELGHGTFCF